MKILRLLHSMLVFVAATVVATSCGDSLPDAETFKYPVTVTSDGNGTAQSDAASAEAGATVKLTATPNEGYSFDKWVVVSGGATISNPAANPATFTMPDGAVSVRAEFKALPPETYSITVTDDGHGTALADAASAEAGATVKLTATPDDGYEFSRWIVVSGGATLSSATANPATFTMPAEDVTVKAEFVAEGAEKFTVTVTDDGNGTGIAEPAEAAQGATVTLTATPDNGYEFDKWVVVSGGVTLSSATTNPATFTMPAKDVTVRAEFKALPPETYSITVGNDGNGTAQANVTSAEAGATITLTATPKNGYEFDKWVVVSGGATLSSATTNPATFTMPDNNVVVRAEFKIIPPVLHSITVNNDGNGTAQANVTSAEAGATITLTATPKNGYEFDKWVVVSGGATLSSATATPATFTMPDNDVVVRAEFKIIPPVLHSITVNSGDNGTAQANVTSAAAGATITLTATPDEGYEFHYWTVESGGVTLSTAIDSPATFTMPDNDVVIRAEFTPILYSITVENNGLGMASSNRLLAPAGATITLTGTPNDGCKFDKWVVLSGGATISNPAANPATFTMPDSNVTVRGDFRLSGSSAGGDGSGEDFTPGGGWSNE